MTTREVNLIVPVRSMQKCALVLVESWDGRPLPIVEDAGRVDENITVIRNGHITIQILNVYVVSASLFAPVCADDLMLRLDILVQAILPREVIEVLEYLLRTGIHG